MLTYHIGSHADEVPPGHSFHDFIIAKIAVIVLSISTACLIHSKGTFKVNVHLCASCEQEKLSADVDDSTAYK